MGIALSSTFAQFNPNQNNNFDPNVAYTQGLPNLNNQNQNSGLNQGPPLNYQYQGLNPGQNQGQPLNYQFQGPNPGYGYSVPNTANVNYPGPFAPGFNYGNPNYPAFAQPQQKLNVDDSLQKMFGNMTPEENDGVQEIFKFMKSLNVGENFEGLKVTAVTKNNSFLQTMISYVEGFFNIIRRVLSILTLGASEGVFSFLQRLFFSH